MGVFINETTTSGVILKAGVDNFAGSITILVIIFIILIMAVMFMFRLPIELSIPLVLPILIVAMAYNGEIIPLGGVALIYAGILFGKWFIS